MNTAEFKKLINKHFSPRIKELGWKGSGSNFYQSTPYHVVNIFGIQGSWMGGTVCCETAIHFDFMPTLGNKDIDISKIKYFSCQMRERLSPKGKGDYHWNLRETEEQNLISINQIWEAFKTHGLAFYNDFANFPYPFDTIQPKDLNWRENYRLLGKYWTHNPIHFVWLLKGINQFIGRPALAGNFAELGMEWTLQHAKEMSEHAKSKKAKAQIEEYVAGYRNMFALK